MEGLENKFCKDWEDCDEVGPSTMQFYDCSWTEYTKGLLGDDVNNYNAIVIFNEKSKIRFLHKICRSYDRVFKVELVVVEEEK